MIIVNGTPSETLAVRDRACMYGDGVFRTMVLRNGVIRCWRGHYEKLAADCAALELRCPDREALNRDIEQIVARQPDGVVKIVVSRGEGGRGYAVEPAQNVTRLVMATSLPDYPENWVTQGVAARTCALRIAHQPRLAGIKHLNRLENVLARREWHDPEIAEGLMLDRDGSVIEGTMSNLFVRHQQTLSTPDLSRCGVAGLQRARIMRLALRLGLRVQVTDIRLETLLRADEAFLCNSVIGVWPIRALDGARLPVGPAAHALRDMLENETD